MIKKGNFWIIVCFLLGWKILFSLSLGETSRPSLLRINPLGSEEKEEMGRPMSLEEWERYVEVKEKIKAKKSILRAVAQINEETIYAQRESAYKREESLARIENQVQKARGATTSASPHRFVGKNPDGTTYVQYSGQNLYILREFLKEKGELDGAKFLNLANGFNPNRVSWTVTWNQKEKDKFGTVFTDLRTVQLFDKDKLPYYVESDSLTPVYESETGEVHWQKVTTITDQIIWKEDSKHYATNKTKAHRLMTAYHQLTRNHELNTNTEVWRDNIEWEVDSRIVGRPWQMLSFHQKVREFAENPATGERYEKTYEMDRYGIENEWSPGEKEDEGQWLTTKYNEKIYNDCRAPGLVTHNFVELEYDEFERVKSLLMVEHKRGEHLDVISIHVETDIKYDPKLGLYKESSLQAEISPSNFSNMDEAIKYGRNLRDVMSNPDLRALVAGRLGVEAIDYRDIDHIKEYDRWICLVMDIIEKGKTIGEAIEEVKGMMGEVSPQVLAEVEKWIGRSLDITNPQDLELIQVWKKIQARGLIFSQIKF